MNKSHDNDRDDRDDRDDRERYDRLEAKAPQAIDGASANEKLSRIRSDLEARLGLAVLYEVVLDRSLSWNDFLARTLPRMTEHFHAKGLGMLGGPHVMICVWTSDRLLVFEARDFFDALEEASSDPGPSIQALIVGLREAAGLLPNPWKNRVAITENTSTSETQKLLTGPSKPAT